MAQWPLIHGKIDAPHRWKAMMDSLAESALALLRKDGRLSFSEIARALGVTRAAIAARVGPMLSCGELRIVAAVHPRLLGLNVMAHLAVRLSDNSEGIATEIIRHTPAVFVSETVGKEQLAVEIHVESIEALGTILRFVRSQRGVVEVQVLIYQHVLDSFFLGAEPEGPRRELDEADSAIIQTLQLDGRSTYAELSKSSGLSITAVRTRLNRLVSTGVLRIGALGQRPKSSGNLTFGFGLSVEGDRTNVEQLLISQIGLEFLARTIGRFDVVATVAFISLAKYNELMDALAKLVEVRQISSWLHVRIHQERYQLISG